MKIDGVGEVLQWGEFWLVVYDTCQHETMFPRGGHRLFESADVKRLVLERYGQCILCHPPRQMA